MKMPHLGPVVLLAAAALCASCSEEAGAEPRTARATPLVCTTFYPVHYFAERIAGDLAEVHCLVPGDEDPLHWRPDDASIQRMQEADLVLLNGADAEKWVFSLSLPTSRTIHTADVFKEDFVLTEGVTHSHGAGDAHTHHGVNPHTWMDPGNAALQAERVRAGLERALPDHREQLIANHRVLTSDLDALLERFTTLGPQPDGEVLVASQPAYDYLARRLGWRVVNVDLDPTAAPDAKDVAAVRERLGGASTRLVLWEREPVASWSKALAELGLRGVVVTPCESQPGAGEPDYLAAMQANANRLQSVWR